MLQSRQFLKHISNWKELKDYDTRIICSDGECRAHRLIFYHVSPFMYSLLDDQYPGEETVYSIPDVSQEIMNLMLEVAYTGTVSLTKSKRPILEEAMKLLGWTRLDKLEEVVMDVETDDGGEETTESGSRVDTDTEVPSMTTDSESEIKTPEAAVDACEPAVNQKDIDQTEITLPETDEATEAKAVMDDLMEKIESKTVDLTGTVALTCETDVEDDIEYIESVAGVAKRPETEKSPSDGNQALDTGKKIGSPNKVNTTSVANGPSNSSSVTACTPDLEIIEELIVIQPESKKRQDRKRKGSGQNAVESKVPPLNKRSSLRIKKIVECKQADFWSSTSDHSLVHSSIPDTNETEVNSSQKEETVEFKNESVTDQNLKMQVTPNKSDTCQRVSKSKSPAASKTGNAVVPDEILDTNGTQDNPTTEPKEGTPTRKRSARVASLLSPNRTGVYSDSEASSTSTKPKARGGKINTSDWKKLTVCVCKAKSSPKKTDDCLATHDYSRCWLCLDAIPSSEFELHLINIHKQKGISEKLTCKWCNSQGDRSWIVQHIVSHNMSQK